MRKKSLPEKIARAFEIVGYLLLIPTIPMVLFSALIIFPLLISVPLFTIGLVLLIGYAKHSRGNLSKGKIFPLWFATFSFNFLPLLFLSFQYYSHADQVLESLNLFSILLIFWWIIACCLSLTALYDEFERGKVRV